MIVGVASVMTNIPKAWRPARTAGKRNLAGLVAALYR
jgi:hypothetical protein